MIRVLLIVALTCIYTINLLAQEIKSAHIIVALCDNQYQGIVPVPEKIGDGDKPSSNLYWGCAYGMKTYFKRSKDWVMIKSYRISDIILERVIFKHIKTNTYLVADAYRGRNINKAISDFIRSCSGKESDILTVKHNGKEVTIGIHNRANLVGFVGHNGLMDIADDSDIYKKLYETDPIFEAGASKKKAIILSCMSSNYFDSQLRMAKAYPLLWTKQFMAPEAYIVKAVLTGWIENESGRQIKERAAKAYSHYQKCSINGARAIFKTGW